VYAIDPDGGPVFHFAARGEDFHGFGRGMNDGGAAQGAPFYSLSDLAARPGSQDLLMAENEYCRLRLVDATGIIRTIAGTDGVPALNEFGDHTSCRFSGDGGPARESGLDGGDGSVPGLPVAVLTAAFGLDGEIFVAERYRIRRIAPDGLIHTVAGRGDSAECWPPDGGFPCCSDEVLPPLETPLFRPRIYGTDASGAVYFSDEACLELRIKVLRPVGATQ
jgi:hypothetical protein